MTDREKVIKGIEHHMKGECGGCPYCKGWHACEAVSENGLFTDTLALLKEYDDVLKLMVYQYCTMKPLTVHDEVFHNKFMSAGEAAFRLLGLENGQSTDGVWERWFPNG